MRRALLLASTAILVLARPAAATPPASAPASRPASRERAIELVYTGRSGGIESTNSNGATVLLLWRYLGAHGGSASIEQSGTGIFRQGERYLFVPEGMRPTAALAALRSPRSSRVLATALPYLESERGIFFQYPPHPELDLLAMFEEQNQRTPIDPQLRRRTGRLLERLGPHGERALVLEGSRAPARASTDPLDWERWFGFRGGARLGDRRASYYAMLKPFGAGARRVRFLDDWRRQRGRPPGLLLGAGGDVDTYDVLDETRSKLRGYELSLLGRLGYDAIVPSHRELYWGPAELIADARRLKLPLVATNLERVLGKNKREPVFARYRLRRVNGLRVAILGALDRDTCSRVRDPESCKDLRFRDPVAAVNQTVHELRDLPGTRPDLVVVLTTLQGKELEELAEEVTGVDVIIGSYGHGGTEVPRELYELPARKDMLYSHPPALIVRSSYTRVGKIRVEYRDDRSGAELLRLRHSQTSLGSDLPLDREAHRRAMAATLSDFGYLDVVLIPDLEDLIGDDDALRKRIRRDSDFRRLFSREDADRWQVWFTPGVISQLIANLLRRAAGVEVAGIKAITHVSTNAPGVVLKEYVSWWVKSEATIALYDLSGLQLRELALTAPREVVLAGLDRRKLLVGGRPIVDAERYQVALDSTVVALETVSRLLASASAQTRFRLTQGRLEPSRRGELVRLRKVVLAALESLRQADPGFGPGYRATLRELLQPQGVARVPRWRLGAENLTVSFSSYSNYPSGSWLRYPGVRETRVATPNNYTLGAKGALFAEYDSAQVTWDTRATFLLSRTVVDLAEVGKGTVIVKAADDLVFSTELRLKFIELGLGKGRSLSLIPYANVTFDTEFTPTVNQLTGEEYPHQKDLLSSLGLITQPGAMLQEVRLAAVLRTDLAAERGQVDAGLLLGVRSEWPLWRARLRIDGTARYFFDTEADTVEKLGLIVQGGATLLVPFTRDFSVSLGADLFLFRPKVLQATDLNQQPVTRGTSASLIFSAGIAFDHAWKLY